MEDTQAPPAGEHEAEMTAPASLSEVLAFQNVDRHETHREAGAGAAEDVAAAAETPEPKPEPIAAPVAQPAPVAETPKIDPATKPEAEQPFWYRKEIEKERKRAQAAERQLEELARRPPQAEPQRGPDPLEDPEAFEAHRQREIHTLRAEIRLEGSEDRFIEKHGEEQLDEVREWLRTKHNGQGNPMEQWALSQRDPWRAAHQQYQREKLAAEIGEDPNAWRDSERERIRQEILAEQAVQQQHIPAAAPQMSRPTPPPPSSTVRSAAPRDGTGRFTGPAPIGGVLKHSF